MVLPKRSLVSFSLLSGSCGGLQAPLFPLAWLVDRGCVVPACEIARNAATPMSVSIPSVIFYDGKLLKAHWKHLILSAKSVLPAV
jgi:hypothetical protein